MYQFTEDCIIGIKEIDDEHRQLFKMLNDVETLISEDADSFAVAEELLLKLKEYAETHFAHEEAYMEKIGDAELSRQKEEHEQFVMKIESYNISECNKEQGMHILNDIVAFMEKWLCCHILGSDIMIGKFTNDKKEEDLFIFTDKYKTGIELLDYEHERLFEIIKKTKDVIDAQFLHDKYDEIVNIVNELKDYTIMHFQDEEKYMELVGYEGLELQKIAHTTFVDRINEINLDDLENNQKECLDDLLQFLLGWLTNHILKMDMQIPKYQEKE